MSPLRKFKHQIRQGRKNKHQFIGRFYYDQYFNTLCKPITRKATNEPK